MNETVEISREDYEFLSRTKKVADTLWNDPKYGIILKEGVKERFPTANIPEVDAMRAARTAQEEARKIAEESSKAVLSRLDSMEKTWKERDEESKKAKEEKEFMSEVESTKRKYNLTAEGMEKVFQRMREKNSPDVEAAAAWVTDHEPKVAPIPSNNYTPQSMDLYGSSSGDKEWEELNRDPLKYGDKVLAEMANDFANNRFDRYKEFGGTL